MSRKPAVKILQNLIGKSEDISFESDDLPQPKKMFLFDQPTTPTLFRTPSMSPTPSDTAETYLAAKNIEEYLNGSRPDWENQLQQHIPCQTNLPSHQEDTEEEGVLDDVPENVQADVPQDVSEDDEGVPKHVEDVPVPEVPFQEDPFLENIPEVTFPEDVDTPGSELEEDIPEGEPELKYQPIIPEVPYIANFPEALHLPEGQNQRWLNHLQTLKQINVAIKESKEKKALALEQVSDLEKLILVLELRKKQHILLHESKNKEENLIVQLVKRRKLF